MESDRSRDARIDPRAGLRVFDPGGALTGVFTKCSPSNRSTRGRPRPSFGNEVRADDDRGSFGGRGSPHGKTEGASRHPIDIAGSLMAGPVEDFAERLWAGTQTEKVDWQLTNDPNILKVDRSAGRIVLRHLAQDVVQLQLFDPDGRLVGSAESDPTIPGPWQPWEVALREMFNVASLQARGTTAVISDLERELGLSQGEEDIPI